MLTLARGTQRVVDRERRPVGLASDRFGLAIYVLEAASDMVVIYVERGRLDEMGWARRPPWIAGADATP